MGAKPSKENHKKQTVPQVLNFNKSRESNSQANTFDNCKDDMGVDCLARELAQAQTNLGNLPELNEAYFSNLEKYAADVQLDENMGETILLNDEELAEVEKELKELELEVQADDELEGLDAEDDLEDEGSSGADEEAADGGDNADGEKTPGEESEKADPIRKCTDSPAAGNPTTEVKPASSFRTIGSQTRESPAVDSHCSSTAAALTKYPTPLSSSTTTSVTITSERDSGRVTATNTVSESADATTATSTSSASGTPCVPQPSTSYSDTRAAGPAESPLALYPTSALEDLASVAKVQLSFRNPARETSCPSLPSAPQRESEGTTPCLDASPEVEGESVKAVGW